MRIIIVTIVIIYLDSCFCFYLTIISRSMVIYVGLQTCILETGFLLTSAKIEPKGMFRVFIWDKESKVGVMSHRSVVLCVVE